MSQVQPEQVLAELAAQGIITIYGDVNGKMVGHVRDMLAVARASHVKELEIQIQSNGGNVSAGLDIYDMIRAVPVAKRKGIVLGYARSMGAVILQACELREAMRHARVLIHYVASDEVSLSSLRNPTKLKRLIAEGERDQKCIDAILTARTGRRLVDVQRACARDADMTSSEALEFGLIDSIRD